MHGSHLCLCCHFNSDNQEAESHFRNTWLAGKSSSQQPGSVFTSTEFEHFLQQNGVVHVQRAPYHPAFNGLAERAVQTFKCGVKQISEGLLETKLSRFLFKYRIMLLTTTGHSPSELLLGRQPRSPLDLLHPDTKARVQRSQARQKYGHDKHARAQAFQDGD